tara:strand:+ start:180 stop:398 length:219 start_codon:yes stop_codon:yes gene_type:complete
LKKKKKQHNKYLTLTSLSLQMGLTVYLGSFIGGWLDEKKSAENNLYTVVCVLLSVFISMYLFIKQAQKINNE